MTQYISIRNQQYELVNATDILVTLLTEATKNQMRDVSSQAAIAYVIKSAVPDIPPELISYRLAKSPEGFIEEIFTQNLNADEVSHFAGLLTIAMMEDRVERLRATEVDSESKKKRLEEGIAKTERTLASAQEFFNGVQLDILLGGVEGIDEAQLNKEISTTQSLVKKRGFARSSTANKKSAVNTSIDKAVTLPNTTKMEHLDASTSPSENDRYQTLQSQIVKMQAEMKLLEENA